ncbi:MAG: 8-oxo-dGTP diphosphatase [Sphaerochaetaceae bacterium]|nr:8-oxo-dGTP diphosphatase [Sphaerochaetaceae bacterium]
MYMILIIIVYINFKQRKLKDSNAKRKAVIYFTVLVMLFEILITTIMVMNLPPLLAIVALALCIGIGFGLRKYVWPYTLHCKKCGKKLDFEHVIGHDDCLCKECHLEEHPEETVKEEKKEEPKVVEEEKEDPLQESFNNAKSVDEIDWELWEPTDRCVITYVEVEGKLLFIEKKRGLGNGYFNAPGGHIEEDETAIEAAIRETKEETGLDIENPHFRGILRFQFANGIREIGYVFFADNAKGELKECDEARPFWQDKESLPYENMWEDDRLWLPGALEGKRFEANFVFDDRKMIDSKVIWLDEEEE